MAAMVDFALDSRQPVSVSVLREMAAVAATLLESPGDLSVAQAVAYRHAQDSEVARPVVQGAPTHHQVSNFDFRARAFPLRGRRRGRKALRKRAVSRRTREHASVRLL